MYRIICETNVIIIYSFYSEYISIQILNMSPSRMKKVLEEWIRVNQHASWFPSHLTLGALLGMSDVKQRNGHARSPAAGCPGTAHMSAQSRLVCTASWDTWSLDRRTDTSEGLAPPAYAPLEGQGSRATTGGHVCLVNPHAHIRTHTHTQAHTYARTHRENNNNSFFCFEQRHRQGRKASYKELRNLERFWIRLIRFVFCLLFRRHDQSDISPICVSSGRGEESVWRARSLPLNLLRLDSPYVRDPHGNQNTENNE